MTRLLITADLHLSVNARDEYRFKFLQRLKKTCKKLEPDHLVIVGDLTEEKDKHPAILVNRIVDELRELAEIVPIVISQGNHDYKEEGQAFFEFVKHIPRISWVLQPQMMNWTPKTLILPHTNNYAKDWKWFMRNGWDCDLILAHQTFDGAEGGFSKLEGIPVDTMQDTMTICGDIHVPQELTRKLIYVGAPYHVDFGDHYQSRMIWIDSNAKNWTSLDTSAWPQKRQIGLFIEDDYDLHKVHFNKGDTVQIRVAVDDMGSWQSIRANIQREAEARGMSVWSIVPKLTQRRQRRQHSVKDQGSDREILESYGKRVGLNDARIKMGAKLL